MPSALRRLLFLLALLPALAPATGDDVHVFWRDGCPHCEKELDFLARAQRADPALRVQRHEIGNPAARALYIATATSLGEVPNAVPFTVVGDRYLTGYFDDASTGAAILAAVAGCRSRAAAGTPCPDPVGALAAGAAGTAPRAAPSPTTTPANSAPAGSLPAHATATAAGNPRGSGLPPTITLPLVGALETAALSLPLLTITLAAIDGFNPCAMWALVFLLGLLAGLQDRRRMWLLGTAFVVASALVYFLFMTAWLNLVLFIGAVGWLRVLIGLVALGGGSWYLYEWKTHRDDTCRVSAVPARRRILDGLRTMAQRRQLPLALAGIVALAFAVNLIELVCSAGIPAVYTQVLAMTPLPPAAHYGYLGLYILVFMLDDLFVLAAALFTLQVTGLTGRYTHAATLVGGIILVALGLVMLLRPGWLAFG